MDEYIAFIKTPIKKPDGGTRPRTESWQSIEGYFNRSARRRFGDMLCGEVTDDDIGELQEDIVAGKYGKPSVSNARHTRNALSKFFKWCAQAGRKYVKASPCVNLAPLDPEVARKRVLSADEIRTLWWGLDRADIPCSCAIALALKFELVTMLRTQEFLKSQPHEFVGLGTTTARFYVPAERVKKRRPLIVPLSDLAQEIVAEARSLDVASPYAFAGAQKLKLVG
jgi:integrase